MAGQPEYDVFISYSAADRERVAALVGLLKRDGRSVWWDQEGVHGGDPYAQVIEEALAGSRVVVSLWSETTRARPDWVYAEAERARQDGRLIPARLDDGELPMPFGALHAIDLRGFDGAPNHPGVVALLNALDRRLEPSAGRRAGRRLRRIQRGPGRRAAVREFLPVLAAAILVIAIQLWVIGHLGTRGKVVVGAVETVMALALGLARVRLGQDGFHRLLATLWEPRALGALGLVVGILACGSSVTVRGKATSVPLRVTVTGSDGALLAGGTIERERPTFHALIAVPPWGREVVVAVEGHRPVRRRLAAWRGFDLPGERLRPSPRMLLRVPKEMNALLSAETRLQVLLDDTELGSAVLGEEHGSARLGDFVIDEAARDRWSELLRGEGLAPADVAFVIAQWANPVELTFDREIPLDATLTAVFHTRANRRKTSLPFSPGGRPSADVLLRFPE